MAGLKEVTEDEIVKKQWTEEERQELASKLDAGLDDFIESLEKRRYDEGWPEDRWQEEMEKHPFFMKKDPQPGDEVHPMLEGLQKLKYDPEENTAEDLAINYKEDGNFYMKHKKFRMAIHSFTEGLKAKCDNPEVQAVLYNNRSAAHYLLKNYRSALADAQKSLEYKSDYDKPRWRGAKCAFELGRFDACTQFCAEILENDACNKEAKELLMKNKEQMFKKHRDERKETAQKSMEKQRFQRLYNSLRKRKLKFYGCQDITPELLQPKYTPLERHPVHFAEDNATLIWPGIFYYPEFLECDFMQNIKETASMKCVIESLFEDALPQDKSHSYRPDNVDVYYDNPKADCVNKVDLKMTVQEIMQKANFFVIDGSLQFHVVRIDLPETEFLKLFPKRVIKAL